MTSALARTQRWMYAVMTDGKAVASGAGEIVHGSARLSAEQRLELYRRTYHRRLTGCLRATYPALRHALGDELFDDFALDYLAARPPRGASLASLGAAFPDHLESTRPDRDMPPERREPWSDFLVDLARLERAFHAVYDGPGVEGAGVPCAADLPAATEPWPAITVEPVPCLRLLRARHPVDDYLLAVRRGDSPSLPAPCERFVALSRRDWVVTLTALDPVEHALLERLVRGADVAAAVAAAQLEGVAAWRLLCAWADRGLFLALHVRSDGEGVR